MRIRPSEIAAWTGGVLAASFNAEDALCTGLNWDSRQVAPGDVYLALPGARVDGHNFVAAALARGAACALVQKSPSERDLQAAREAGAAIVQVNDSMEALCKLAARWRAACPAKVLALTGSSGKTTTKNLLARVLSAHGATIATLSNQNNELGVPATLLRIQPETRFAVVEMGMRGLHQLEPLCQLAKPNMALVTNVGTSHIELLGSRENIARAKAEPFACLKAGGTAFINSSDEYAASLRRFGNTQREGITEVFFDGSGAPPASYPQDMRPVAWASNIALDASGCASFTINLPGQTAPCRLQMHGLHNVHNAMAAAAVGFALGMDAAAVASALEGATETAGRSQVTINKSGVTVIDDAYNANPDSMRASLNMFAAMQVPGKRYAVLGDMGELGAYARQGHVQMGECAAQSGLDCLYCVGALSKDIAEAACAAGMPEGAVYHCMDAMEILARLKEELKCGDAVLVKASHAMALERIVEGLAD